MTVTRSAGARSLINALAWRTRQEGLRYVSLAFVPFILSSGLAVTVALVDGSGINGQSGLRAVTTRYGSGSDSIAVGVALVIVPGLLALFSSAAVSMVVRNMVGSEVGRGGLEALLGGPFRPQTIAVALLGYAGGLAVLFWAGMTGLAVVGFIAITLGTHGSLTLSAAYLLLVLILPLLAAVAGTGLSLLVSLLNPRLTRPGQFGIAVSGGSLSGAAALLPALAVFFTLTLLTDQVAAGVLLLTAGGATGLIAAGSALIVGRRFRPETVLDS
jgi:hypothetical protein